MQGVCNNNLRAEKNEKRIFADMRAIWGNSALTAFNRCILSKQGPLWRFLVLALVGYELHVQTGSRSGRLGCDFAGGGEQSALPPNIPLLLSHLRKYGI